MTGKMINDMGGDNMNKIKLLRIVFLAGLVLLMVVPAVLAGHCDTENQFVAM